MAYWVKLKNDKPFCLMVNPERVKSIMNNHKKWDDTHNLWMFDQVSYNEAMQKFLQKVASQYGEVESIDTLPYPASPIKTDKPGEESYEWTLCYTPNECCGKTSCPKSRACSE